MRSPIDQLSLSAMRFPSFSRVICTVVALVFVLAGCADFIRTDANAQLREGNYEAAVQLLNEGLAKYPENPNLRAGLISTRTEATARLAAQADQQRMAGQFDEAGKTLTRALTLDPKNDRLLALQAELDKERQIQKSLGDALSLVQTNKVKALAVVDEALRLSPRHTALLSLQRKLQTQIRLESGADGARVLAEFRPITLDFRNAPLSSVLEAITHGSGINFVLDKDVKLENRVTLYLRSARVEDAIDLVVQAHQLARTILDSQTVLIYPNTPEKIREHQEQVIRVFHLSNTDAKSTASLLRTILKIKEPFVDEHANFVALRETPEVIAMAERLIALQDMGEAEVMLEVEILEVQTSRLTELGIQFPSSMTLTPLPATGATGLTVNSFRAINADRVGVSLSNNLLVNLRREVGDVNVLANPRIRAKSREKARILIGDKLPVVSTSTSSTGFLSESINYLDVGIKLDVEPVVSPDEDVSIKLGLEVSTLISQVTTAGGSTAYTVGTRNANTVLRLRDGETQLLGGLISNEDRSNANRVPGLGDIPILGRLFSSQKDDKKRTELVLAITPRILHSAPRPDLAQAQMWVGTEGSPRLRSAPVRTTRPVEVVEPSANADSPLPVVPATPALPASAVVSLTAVDAAPSSAPLQPSPSAPPSPAAPASPVTAVRSPAAVSAGPIQTSWSVPADLKVGTEFTAVLNLSSSVPLMGVPFELSFPAQSLEIVNVQEGTYFKKSDGTTSFTRAVNPQTGRISVGILGYEPQGTKGQGALLRLRLKAKEAGSFDVPLSSFKPIAAKNSSELTVGTLPVLHLEVK